MADQRENLGPDNLPNEGESPLASETCDRETGDYPAAPRKRTKPPSIRVAPLNITSFLDMSFCLLTFLILSASMSPSEGVLSGKLPKTEPPISPANAEAAPPQREVKILVSSTSVDACRITIQGLPLSSNDAKSLTAQLQKMQFNDANPQGVYKTDNPILLAVAPGDTAHWQHMVNVYNAVVAAKYSNIAFESPEPSSAAEPG